MLHKWHSNAMELESYIVDDGEATYAKETLGTKPSDTKLLGLGWNKKEDTLLVSLTKEKIEVTKLGHLRSEAWMGRRVETPMDGMVRQSAKHINLPEKHSQREIINYRNQHTWVFRCQHSGML